LKSGIYKYTESSGWAVIPTGKLDSSIHAITQTGLNLFIGTDTGIYRSSNNGADWTRMTGDTMYVQSFWVNDLIIAAGTKKGIYISSDNGVSWQFQQSAGKLSVNQFYTANRNLYAATDSGVVAAPLAQYRVTSSDQSLLSLSATNPSVNQAIIYYSIPVHASVSLTCIDLLGRQSSILFSGERDPGKYELQWNTSALSAGTYILRLSANMVQKDMIITILH
jgi:hypothetical protein